MRNFTENISNLFAETLNGRSVWTVDWIGNPYDFAVRDGSSQVDVYVSRTDAESGAADSSAECISVPFAELGWLNDPCERPKHPKDGWSPPLRTRGAHFRLDISPRHSTVYSLPDVLRLIANPGSGQPAFSTRYHLGERVLSNADNFRVIGIPDKHGIDPLFCVVSCTEAVRHFFCTSNHLAKHLLSGWQELLWTEGCLALRKEPDVRVGLKRNLGTQVSDGATLSQYLADRHFRDVADSVRKSQQRVRQGSTPRPFQCGFPIAKDCWINVEAIQLPSNTPLGYRFFVTRIVETPRPTSYSNCWVQYEPEQPPPPASHSTDQVPEPITRPWRPATFNKYPSLRTFVCMRQE